jgi:glyoxylase-like metal-dependent hydrolase (beta-lactamase superfamily II)
MKRISENIVFIQGQDEFIPDSHVYIIGEPSSKDLSLVDAGLMGKGPYKIEAIQKMDVEPSHIRRIIMTHTHLDHIGCLGEILRQLTDVELWIHNREADFLEQGDERTVYGMEMFRDLCQSQFGIQPGAFRFQTDRRLEGGEHLSIGGMSWEVIHVPGHSIGSIALYEPTAKVLIPGDVVYADYAIGRFDLHLADGGQLEKSLLRLAELEVQVLLPGHNRIVEDVPPRYILETAKQWAPYLK